MMQQAILQFLTLNHWMKGCLLVVIMVIASTVSIDAQLDSTEAKVGDEVLVILKDGSELRGTIQESTTTSIKLKTLLLNTIEISLEEITQISFHEWAMDTIQSDSKIENPFYSRNLVTETAIPLKKGEGYYQNFMLIANTISYGISDQFSIGGGLEYVSLFNGQSPYMLLQTKYGVSSSENHFHFSLGANLISESGGVNTQVTGSLFSIGTYGTRNNNLSIGIGYGFFEGVQFQIGGMVQLSKNLMLVSDHIFLTPNFFTAQIGSWTFRYFGPRFSLDFGVGIGYGEGTIPLISFSHKFD